eukprot:4171588-Pyramimonas_sp.AAC.1
MTWKRLTGYGKRRWVGTLRRRWVEEVNWMWKRRWVEAGSEGRESICGRLNEQELFERSWLSTRVKQDESADGEAAELGYQDPGEPQPGEEARGVASLSSAGPQRLLLSKRRSGGRLRGDALLGFKHGPGERPVRKEPLELQERPRAPGKPARAPGPPTRAL